MLVLAYCWDKLEFHDQPKHSRRLETINDNQPLFAAKNHLLRGKILCHQNVDSSVPFNREKLRIYEKISGEFAVIIQRCVKKSGVFANIFQFVEIFAVLLAKFLTKCLMRGRQ